jgi:hypothetical protein
VHEKSQIHPKTLERYSAGLRKIASNIHRLDDSSKRADSRAQVDNVKLATLTAERIEEWRTRFIRRGSTTPLAEKSAKVSSNSFIGALGRFSAPMSSRESKTSSRFHLLLPSPM